jgi:hypothetical protein
VRTQAVDRWTRRAPREAPDLSRATFLALLAVIAFPALLVATSLGWRPVDPAVVDAFTSQLASLRGRAEAPAGASPATDWQIADGWFFTQLSVPSGQSGAAGDGPKGIAVTDRDGVPFWSEFQRLGGLAHLGYPISQRFSLNEMTYQAFQRAVLRFDPAQGTIVTVAVLDHLHAVGLDDRLVAEWGIPPLGLPVRPAAESPEARAAWLLAEYPALQSYLSGLPDAATLLGLPTSTVQDFGGYHVVRFQSGALQQWKEDVPWAAKGQVTAVNVGEIAARLELIPADALAPAPAE